MTSVAMEIEDSVVDDVVILRLKGYVDSSGGGLLLRNKVRRLAVEGRRKVVLDVERARLADSAGFAEIVQTHITLSKRGGTLKLLNVTQPVRALLSMTKLINVFETFDSEQEAVRSFSSSG